VKVWNNLKLSGYIYSNQQNDLATYTNNRRSDLVFDAEGNVTWNAGYSNTIDVTSDNVKATATRTVGDGSAQFPNSPAEEITQAYDGDGRPRKRNGIKRQNVYDENGSLIQVLEDSQTSHYIYSNVLGAQVVELDTSGQASVWVYAGGERIATTSYGSVTFEHHNPVTTSRITTNGHSGYRATTRQERDPQTGPVPLSNPGGAFSPAQNWNQPLLFIGGDPSERCRLRSHRHFWRTRRR